jgi:DNA-binding NtrC family response regulator
VQLPPLRERGTDILLLARHYLDRACSEYGLPLKILAADAEAALQAYPWPGNVRELQNVIERAVILCCDGECLSVEHMGLARHSEATPPTLTQTLPSVSISSPDPQDQLLTLGELEKQHIFRALEKCNGNRTHAAKLLEISIRTLRNKLHEYSGKGKSSEAVDAEGQDLVKGQI